MPDIRAELKQLSDELKAATAHYEQQKASVNQGEVMPLTDALAILIGRFSDVSKKLDALAELR